MFKVYLTNFGYFLQDSFATRAEAQKEGRRNGFAYSVVEIENPELENAEADLAMFEMGL